VRTLGRPSLTEPLLGRVWFAKDANDELVLPADERERVCDFVLKLGRADERATSIRREHR